MSHIFMQGTKWILLRNHILDKTSHIITQRRCRAYGAGRRGCDGGGVLA